MCINGPSLKSSILTHKNRIFPVKTAVLLGDSIPLSQDAEIKAVFNLADLMQMGVISESQAAAHDLVAVMTGEKATPCCGTTC